MKANWGENLGTTRINFIRPLYARYWGHSALAAQNLRAAALVFAGTRIKSDVLRETLRTASLSLVPVLGTPYEVAAHDVVRQRPDVFEEELLRIARASAEQDILLDDAMQPEKVNAVSLESRLGAIRLLGLTHSQPGRALLANLAKDGNPRLREAVASALGSYESGQGVELLKQLARDADAQVAFTACHSLWSRGERDDAMLAFARKMIDQAVPRYRIPAASMLAELGSVDDAPSLRELAREDSSPAVRQSAMRGLRRLGATQEDIRASLVDMDSVVVAEALEALTPETATKHVPQLQRLANDPFVNIAEAARLALAPCRPAGGREQLVFDLAIEHPYRRMQLVETLAVSTEPWAQDELLAACANCHPHVRVAAMTRLLERSPEQGLSQLLHCIDDPYLWVRLHAAAALSTRATQEMAPALRKSLDAETDAAVRLYLTDALARAEGRPRPAAPPAARGVAGERTLSWMCGTGDDIEHSPYEAYYIGDVAVDETWKKGYQAGKIFFGRANAVWNPGLIVVNQRADDQFWLTIDSQLTPDRLPYLDGVVFGEETMEMNTVELWPDAWRLFCLDAGIDPERVRGEMNTLNVYEQRAWRYWALQRQIDGFNRIYDYVHLKYGKLRPGIQVATFLTEQSLLRNGANPGDLRWRFDVGGIYDYKGCTRMSAYNLVRRMKTLWPERPIIWLSLGIGGAEMNPVKRTQSVPSAPITSRSNRAWVDTITAYMAGADAGWFSIWIFVAKDWKGDAFSLSGVWCHLEDIVKGSRALDNALAYAWRGAENDNTDAQSMPSMPDVEDMIDTNVAEPAEKTAETIARDMESFRQGFFHYRQYVDNCARVFTGLPRQHVEPPALAIRPNVSVWTRPEAPYPLAPGMELLDAYDYLCDINITAQFNLARYRFIAVHDPGPVTDQTITHLARWLTEQAGILYVHQNLTADNANEASTPEDHDGILQKDWPWEKDVAIERIAKPAPSGPLTLVGADGELALTAGQLVSTFTVTGKNAHVIFTCGGKPCLVFWRNPGTMKGGVLFDGVKNASQEYLLALRAVINDLHTREGIGLELTSRILHNAMRDARLTGETCTGLYPTVSETATLAGIDLLTGKVNPMVGGKRSGTLIATEYVGKYVASFNGISILCDRPIITVKPVEGGVEVKCDGLIRAAAMNGAMNISDADGVALPAISGQEPWILDGSEPGVMTLSIDGTDSTVTYIRSPHPTRIVQMRNSADDNAD